MQPPPRVQLLQVGLNLLLGTALLVLSSPYATWRLLPQPGPTPTPLPSRLGLKVSLGSREVGISGPLRNPLLEGGSLPEASPLGSREQGMGGHLRTPPLEGGGFLEVGDSAESSFPAIPLFHEASSPAEGTPSSSSSSATLAGEEAAGSFLDSSSSAQADISSGISSDISSLGRSSDSSGSMGSSTAEAPGPGSSTEAGAGQEALPLVVDPGDPNFRSQMRQDRWLLEQLFHGRAQHREEGVFVEFGARNGQAHSNTHFFEKTFGWKGILAEASEKEWGDIAETRSASAVIRGAFCSKEGRAAFGDLGVGLGGFLATYDPQRRQAYDPPAVEAQCYRLDRVLDEFGVRAIDYMSVDTEGSELDALAAFPFRRVPVRVVGIEVLIGPGREGRVEKTIRFMDERGYKLRHKYSVADDTLDIFFEPKQFDPQVFDRPRVDAAGFAEARRVCREETKVCL